MAVTALSEAHQEARDMGAERREGVRKRVEGIVKETAVGKEGEIST